MSDLLEAAASALGTPTALVQRAAAARAAANGTTVDEVLSAWAGGATVAPAAPAAAPEAAPEAAAAASAPEPAPAATAVAVMEPPPTPEPGVVYIEETVPLDPVPLATRVRTAVRVGAWTGAALGLIGFLAATAFWAPMATVDENARTVVQASTRGIMIGIGLVSIVFGAIVASLSRAAASWRDPAMQLSGSRSSTGWIGAGIGLVLGVAAGALLAGGFGTPVESEEATGLVLLPVLPTLGVMLIGGAVLGAITAAVPQIFGTPVALGAEDAYEVQEVKGRIRHAVTVPLLGVGMLLLFVLPFAYMLLEANHLVSGAGAAMVAIIAAGGILGFSALAGSKPNMRITPGEALVALIGVGTVVLVIIAVFVFRGGAH